MRRIWSLVSVFLLASSQISGLFSADVQTVPFQNDAQTRLLLHLDEKAGAKAVDGSSFGNNGFFGSAKWNESGRFGGCLYFDGDWDVIRCGTDGSLSPTDQITFECWVKPEAVDGIRQIISKDIIGAPWNEYHLQICNGKVLAGITTTTKHYSLTSSQDIELNKWTHLAGVYDGETFRLCINGAPAAETKATGTIVDSGKQLNLGAWSSSYWYKGYIDEVRISSVARYGEAKKKAVLNDDFSGKIVIFRSAAPVIDGKFAAEEWPPALKSNGFLKNTDSQPTNRPQPEIFLSFDEHNLYVGFAAPFEGELKRDARGHDIAAAGDDDIEIFLDPFRSGVSYQFIVNPSGAYYELKGSNRNWGGKWRYATSESGNRWFGEIAIPFSELGRDTPYDGAEWGINICRDYKNPTEWTSLAGIKGAFNQPGLFLTAVFQGGPSEIKLSSSSLRLSYSVTGIAEKFLEAVVDVSAVPPAQRKMINGIAVLNNSAGKETVQAKFGEYKGTKGLARLPVTRIPAGEYQLVASFYKDGTLIGEQQIVFLKPDSAKWLGNKIGIDDSVPAPWTPLEIKGNTIACWNRQYRFDGSPFPAAVEIGNESILARPIQIKGQADGKDINWSAGKINFQQRGRDRAEFSVDNASDSISLQSRVAVEFDGLIRVDLKFVPEKAVNLQKLCLEITLKNKYAALRYQAKHPGGFYDPNILGSVPDVWQGSFTPYIWLGNQDLGLAWFTEDYRNWHLKDKDKAVEIVKDKDQVLLRINLVDSDFNLAAPLTLTFGLQATPVKPLPRNWQTVHVSCWEEDNPNMLIEWAHSWVVKWFAFPEYLDPSDKKAIYGGSEQRINDAHRKGFKYIQYINVNCASAGIPAYRYFEPEWWALSPSDSTGDVDIMGYPLMMVCPQTSWSDFFVYSVRKFVEQNNVDGLYADNALIHPCDNTGHNHRYQVDGKTEDTYPIFATRELQKRIYKYAKSRNPNFILIAHTAGALQIPFISFFDIYIEGERFMGNYLKKYAGNYIDAVPLDKFQAEFVGKNWGLVPVLIAELKGFIDNPKYTEEMMALARVNGANIWPGTTVANRDVVNRIWKAELDFGIGDADFLPYWNNREIAAASSDKVEVSLYARKDRVLLYAVNLSDQETEESIRLDFKRLGFSDNLKATDIYSGNKAELSQGILKVNIKGKNFRMIQLAP